MLNANLNRPDEPTQIELPTVDLLTQAPGKVPALGPDGRAIQRKRQPKKKPAPKKPQAAKAQPSKAQAPKTQVKKPAASPKKTLSKPGKKGPVTPPWPPTAPEKVELKYFSLPDEKLETTIPSKRYADARI